MGSRDTRRLRIEIEEIRNTVHTLLERLAVLEDEVGEVEQASREEQRSRVASSSASFSRISSVSSAVPVEPSDHLGRQALAQQIGQFIRRALAGEPLGSSGRDRLSLQNRCYLIFAEYEGNQLQPPVFTKQFAEVKGRCKRGSDCGRSIFIGLATAWEAVVVVEEAGCDLPASLRNGGNWGPLWGLTGLVWRDCT